MNLALQLVCAANVHCVDATQPLLPPRFILLQVDLIVVPLLDSDSHWSFALIRLKVRTVEIINSSSGDGAGG